MRKLYYLNCQHWSAICSLLVGKSISVSSVGLSSKYIWIKLPNHKVAHREICRVSKGRL